MDIGPPKLPPEGIPPLSQRNSSGSNASENQPPRARQIPPMPQQPVPTRLIPGNLAAGDPRPLRVNPAVNSFWGGEEPEDNNPRFTMDARTTRATATRAAAPSSAEEFFGLREASSQQASKTFGSKVRGVISPLLNPEAARAQRIDEAVRGLLHTLEVEGEGKLLTAAMDKVLQVCDGPQGLRDFTTAVQQRVNTQTRTATGLEGLHACVARASARPGDVSYLRAVSDSAARGLERLNPALSPSLRMGLLRALREPGDPWTSQGHFNDALSEANRMIDDLGPGVASTPHEIVLDALAYVAQPELHLGVEPLDSVKAFFALLPPQQLKQVAQTKPHGSPLLSKMCAQLVECAQAEMAARGVKAKGNLERAMDEIDNWRHDPDSNVVDDPLALARKLIEASEYWDALMFYGGKSDLSDKVLMPVEILCQPSNLKLIDPATFKKLEGALTKLNLAGNGEAALELEQRRAEMLTAQMASSGYVVQALLLIGNGKTLAEAVTMIRAELQNRDGQTGYARVKFRQQLTEHVGKLPAAERAALSVLMSSGDMVNLGSTLLDLSRGTHVKEHDGLADELLDLGSALSAVRDALRAGSAVPQPPNLEELSPDVCAALEACRIEIGTNNNPNVRSGVASKALQMAVSDDLAKRMGGSTVNGLALDITDVDYSMNGERIVEDREVLASKEVLRAAQDGREAFTKGDRAMDNAFAQARKLAPTPELKTALSRLANFEAWAPVVALMSSPDSPVRLPDGTPVELAGERTTAFDVRSDGKGGLLVSCRLIIAKPAYGVITEPGGRRRKVEVDMPGRIFSYEVAITPGGHASLSKPVEVDPCLWAHKSYAKPRDAFEITSRYADPKLVQDFRAFLVKEHSEENFTMITALNKFQSNPTVRDAQAIFDKYIAKDEGAPKVGGLQSDVISERLEANISDSLRQLAKDALRNAIADPGTDTMNEVVTQFAAVHYALSELVNTDSFRRFPGKLEESARTAVTKTLEVAFDTEEATPAVELAPVAGGGDLDERAMRNIAVRLNLIAKPLVTADWIARAAFLLPAAFPQEMTDLFTPPGTAEYWQQFQRHLELPLEALNPVELASLRYNLEITLDNASRQEPHVQRLIAAATNAMKGTRQGQMPLESVLLGARSIPVNLTLLGAWYDQGRVNSQEVESALARVGGDALRALEGRSSLWPLASRFLMPGDSETQRLAMDFIKDAKELMNLIRGQATLTRAMAGSVVRLGAQFDRYNVNRNLPGRDPERTNTDELMQKCAQDLVSTLAPLLGGFSGAGMLPKDLKALRKSLVSFDAPTDEVERAIALAAVAEKALEARLAARDILPSPSEADVGPPPEDDVPPAPLDDDDLPRPPNDDEPPPPAPEDPQDDAALPPEAMPLARPRR